MVKWIRQQRGIFLDNARLVDPGRGEFHGRLRLAGERIDGINISPQRSDLRFDLEGAYVLPGLVNAHDHLELNNFPRLKYRACYANAQEWAADVNARLELDPDIAAARKVPLADRLFFGGLKNLLSGVTTVAHHNPFYAPLGKNFPVRVVRQYGWAHSLYLTPDFGKSYRRTRRNAPWMIHLAEGTDAEAQGELCRLDVSGALHDNTVLIHGVGLREEDRKSAVERGAALVWCPSSNLFLLGETAKVREFSDAHLLAIGSDSRLTGERDLLDELGIARATGQIEGGALVRAVTADASRILRLRDAGEIELGARADLVVLPGVTETAADAMGKIRRSDLRAVIMGGEVRVGDPDFVPLMQDPVPARLDGRDKVLAKTLLPGIQRGPAEAGLDLG